MRKSILSCFVLFVVIIPCRLCVYAQDSSTALRFGLFGGYALNKHVAQFQKIEGTESCCNGFNGGNGSGIIVGLLVEKQITDVFLADLRLSYAQLNGSMTTPESTTVLFDSDTTTGVFEHRLKATLAVGSIEPIVGFRLFDNIIFHQGIRAGFLLSKNYEQYEQITQPTGRGTFITADGHDTQKRTRNEFARNIPNANSLQLSLVLGLSMEFPLNKKGSMYLAPEVWYDVGLSSITPRNDNTTWSVNSWRFGVALKYGTPFSDEPTEERRQQRFIDTLRVPSTTVATETFIEGESTTRYDTMMTKERYRITAFLRRTDTLFVPLPPAKVAATLNLASVNDKGREDALKSIQIEEFITSYSTPLLNYIFFEENASDIPVRYKRLSSTQAASFSVRDVDVSEKLSCYYQTLNILGRRMKELGKGSITLIGCNQDVRAEKGNTTLSRARAMAIQRYLTEVWGIDESRIAIETRNLPEQASNSQTSDGAQENRRVEISSEDKALFAELFAPATTVDTSQSVAPFAIRFKPRVSVPTLQNWRLEVQQGNRLLKSFEGSTLLPEMLTWNLHDESTMFPQNDATLDYILRLRANDTTVQTQGRIGVEQISITRKRSERRSDKTIDRFSLILFAVRSAELNEACLRILQSVKNRITPESRISIRGYTDRSGDAVVNRQLAESRARNTANALEARDRAQISAESSTLLFDNELPEGRFYCRTVDISIETPVR